MTVRDAVLAAPGGWLVDPIVHQRLSDQLARAGPSTRGVAALAGELPPGSSARVLAERGTLRPLSDAVATSERSIRGAVLLRAGVRFEVSEDEVRLEPGELVFDPGASVHDPWRPLGPLQPASPLGRPPFPARPVVLLLGFERDPDLADWVRATVNGLVRHDTEGRIAVPEPTGGLHLTRPCLPVAASVTNLRPDVVVALDDVAATRAEKWLGDDRSAVIICLTPDTGATIELIPWRIGAAQGRRRAQFGRGITPQSLADLVRRMGAGPQTLPPRDRRRSEEPAGRPRTREPGRGAPFPPTHVVALVGTGADATRYRALAEHARAFAVHLDVATISPDTHDARGAAASAATADLVLVRGLSKAAMSLDIVERRRARGLATIIDIGPEDVRTHGERRIELVRPTLELARASGLVTTPSPAVAAAVRALGLRAQVVPTLLTTKRIDALERLRETASPGATIGWHTGSADHGSYDDEDESLRRVLRAALARRPDVEVALVGNAVARAGTLADHPRVRVAPGALDIRSVARWVVQCWTTPALEAELDGDVQPAVEAGYVGVPTLTNMDNPAVREGLVVRALAIDDAAGRGWEVLQQLVDDAPARAARSDEVAGLARALYGPVSAMSVVNRLLGWTRYEGAA
jgi:hypothetical protein